MVKIYWNFFQICPEKNSDHFSIWSEKLKFGRKTADRRPLFQALQLGIRHFSTVLLLSTVNSLTPYHPYLSLEYM